MKENRLKNNVEDTDKCENYEEYVIESCENAEIAWFKTEESKTFFSINKIKIIHKDTNEEKEMGITIDNIKSGDMNIYLQ